jgi:hypothetical protein
MSRANNVTFVLQSSVAITGSMPAFTPTSVLRKMANDKLDERDKLSDAAGKNIIALQKCCFPFHCLLIE